MRNKILVVEHEKVAREQLESILQEIVEEGGELIFSQKKEDALDILHKEHPILVFLESQYAQEDQEVWNLEGVHIILTYPNGAQVIPDREYLFKPFKSLQVLEKCKQYLNREFVPPIPPM